MTRINKALDPATRAGRVHRPDADRAGGGRGAGRRARGDVPARPAALLRGRLPGVRRPRRPGRRRADRRRRLGRGGRPRRPRARKGDRLPLLTRMIGAPLFVDIGPGTVAQLAPLLADRRISAGGHVAVVVGPGLGEEIAEHAAARSSRTPTSGRSPTAAASTRRTRSPSGCARASTTRWSGSAAGARSTSPSSPRRSAACRWSRSRPASPTTASRRRSPRSRRAAARAPTASRCRSRWSSTSTTCAAATPACAAPASAT